MKKLTKEIKKILQFNWGLRVKLLAEGNKLWAEGDKLRAEGNKLWAETILEFCGNIKIEWIWDKNKNDYSCKLENGEVFNP